MASLNPFEVLGDDDNEDPAQLFAAAQKQKDDAKSAAEQKQKNAAKSAAATPQIPTKPVPPAQAVRESRINSGPQRGGFRAGRGGRGRGGGRLYSNRDHGNAEENGFPGGYGSEEEREPGKPSQRVPRQPYRGGRLGGYANEDVEGASERPRQRVFERHSGTGRGYQIKREGAGRGNWGTPTDDVIAQEPVEVVNAEDNGPTSVKQMENGIPTSETENNGKEEAAKETEDKEMTLEEFERVREEKRKVLLSMKTEERKVDLKEFESMQRLSIKKGNEEIFIKLGSDKDSRKPRENGERDEKAKKSISINEFLKASDGRRSGRGRGLGRGRSNRGSGAALGGDGNATSPSEAVIEIADPRQFPTL